MKRAAWKWMFGICLFLLIGIALFSVGLWVVLNVTGALLFSLMSYTENIEYHPTTFGEFLTHFPGSPAFYAMLFAALGLVVSIIGLVQTRKPKDSP